MRRHMSLLAALVFLAGSFACKSTPPDSGEASVGEAESTESNESAANDGEVVALDDQPPEAHQEMATFAGGCFWCMEPPFDELDGVEATISGYTGGQKSHPTYREVAGGATDHAEAVRVYYDPEKVDYQKLLDVFWRNIDPTQENGQFVDHGRQYRTAIFVHDDEQRRLAEQSKEELAESDRFDKPIVTDIEEAGTFWRAEEYHQDFYKKDPGRYKSYRRGSGRDEFIERVWGDSK
jgi:peptide methionine sulfoxide reductase msrA/msrB